MVLTMRNKDIKEAERLVAKFFDGTTTLGEERRLYRLLSRGSLPPELERYRPVFAAFGAMQAGVGRSVRLWHEFRRALCATAAVLAVVLGMTFYAGFREERMLARVYGGSYVIDNGRRIDDLSRIRGDIERALGEADRIEARLEGPGFIERTEQDVLN